LAGPTGVAIAAAHPGQLPRDDRSADPHRQGPGTRGHNWQTRLSCSGSMTTWRALRIAVRKPPLADKQRQDVCPAGWRID
jgi:hypothetical protein